MAKRSNVKSIPVSVYAGPALSPSNVVRVPLGELHIQPGYNVRSDFNPEKSETDAALLKSIRKNGIQTPLTAEIGEDGRAYIVQGHGRYMSATMLSTQKVAGFATVPVLLSTLQGAAKDADLFISNSGRPLSLLEQARLARRMVDNHGWTTNKIADAAGFKNVKMAQNLLDIAALPESVLVFVERGNVAATLAMEIVKSVGEARAVELFTAALAEQAKKTAWNEIAKVTRQHLLAIDDSLPRKGNTGARQPAANENADESDESDAPGTNVTGHTRKPFKAKFLRVEPAGDGSADVMVIDGDYILAPFDTVADANHFLRALDSVFADSPMFAKLAADKARAAAKAKPAKKSGKGGASAAA